LNDLTPEPTGTVASPERSGAWSVFLSTFLTIFLAELGDKTQLTTLMMTAESHKPWVVFGGAACALILTSLLGVLLGRWLAKVLAPRTLELGAGLTLLIIAASLGWETLRNWQ
jgi:Ca2+/H+ antiporter, TMEM165/GDT1 family